MPAVQIARLKSQTAQLVDAFSQPALFRRRLHDLLDFYSDHTYRAGSSGHKASLLPHYRIAPPVIRQIQFELAPLCEQAPLQALELADNLWANGYLETRLLAIYLLSQIPPTPPDPLIARLHAWARPEEDREILAALLSSGNTRLQRELPNLWLLQVKGWLTDADQGMQGIGLRAMLSIVKDPTFGNLPVIFNMLVPNMQSIPSRLQADYLDLLEALVQRSASETAFFLRQSINASRDPATGRLVRKCLPFFSPELQAGLRATLLNRAKENQ
jgi:hypothetical protein